MQLLFSISGSDLTVATWISCSYSDVSQGFIVELPNISDPYHAIRSNYVCTHCILCTGELQVLYWQNYFNYGCRF